MVVVVVRGGGTFSNWVRLSKRKLLYKKIKSYRQTKSIKKTIFYTLKCVQFTQLEDFFRRWTLWGQVFLQNCLFKKSKSYFSVFQVTMRQNGTLLVCIVNLIRLWNRHWIDRFYIKTQYFAAPSYKWNMKQKKIEVFLAFGYDMCKIYIKQDMNE